MSVTNVALTDLLALNESVNQRYIRIRNPGIVELLVIIQTVRFTITRSPLNITVKDTVTVTDIIQASILIPVEDSVHVKDTIGFALSSSKSGITDTLAFREAVAAVILPQGQGGYAIVDPIVNAYASSLIPEVFKLTYNSTHVTLRSPDFGDSDSYEAFRIQRENRGGDLQILQDPMWPTTEILDFKFSQIDDPTDFIAFLTASLGAQITLKDQYGRTWLGYILTPQGQIVQPKRTTFTIAFKFQGVLQT